MTWFLGLALFVAGIAVGIAVSVASRATAREIDRLDRQWTLAPRRPPR